MEEHSISRVAQIVGVFIGIVGLYLAGMSAMNVYSAFTSEWMLLFLAVPMLAISIVMIIIAYRAIFDQTQKTFDSISAFMAFMVMLYADDLIEPIIIDLEAISHPQITVTAITICCAVVVYYGLRQTMHMEAKRLKPNTYKAP